MNYKMFFDSSESENILLKNEINSESGNKNDIDKMFDGYLSEGGMPDTFKSVIYVKKLKNLS